MFCNANKVMIFLILTRERKIMDYIIAIIGAATSIVIAVLGSIYVNVNNIKMQNRKLKEEHYINYIQGLHMLAAHNEDKAAVETYTLHRDKIFVIANENVVRAILKYEENVVGQANSQHDELLTQIYIEIRNDLKVKDKDFPIVCLKKA